MRNIWAVLIASFVATGCIITTDGGDDGPGPGPVCGDAVATGGEQCDDGNTVSGDGCSASCTVEGGGETYKVNADWEFKNVNGATTTCPSGYPTIAHYNQPVDGNGNSVGSPVIDLYDCVDGANFTDPLPAGFYTTWLESTTDDGTGVYAQSTSASIDLSADVSVSWAIFNDGGYFSLGWTLRGASSGNPLTCAEAAADGVEIVATLAGPNTATTDKFDCDAHYGLTASLLAGSYTVSVDAFQDGAGAIGAPQNDSGVIGDRNRVTELGTFDLPIDGK